MHVERVGAHDRVVRAKPAEAHSAAAGEAAAHVRRVECSGDLAPPPPKQRVAHCIGTVPSALLDEKARPAGPAGGRRSLARAAHERGATTHWYAATGGGIDDGTLPCRVRRRRP